MANTQMILDFKFCSMAISLNTTNVSRNLFIYLSYLFI